MAQSFTRMNNCVKENVPDQYPWSALDNLHAHQAHGTGRGSYVP